MKQLVTIALVLAALFASTFLLLKATGTLPTEQIVALITDAQEINGAYVAAWIIVVLFADLFIAIPTLTVSMLSGYSLGPLVGGICAVIGMMMAGVTGYAISWRYGPKLLVKIYRDPSKLQEMQRIFSNQGTIMLIMCRAAPILPEVCCCLAGANRMPLSRFLSCYAVATVPYAFIAAYAGAMSSLANPMPAIMTAIAISSSLWLAWFMVLRNGHKRRLSQTKHPRSKNPVLPDTSY